jgi:hypothetical protein
MVSSFAHAHPVWSLVLAWLLTGLVSLATQVHSPEEWEALADKSPKLHKAIKLLRAVGLNLPSVWRIVQPLIAALIARLTGRVAAVLVLGLALCAGAGVGCAGSQVRAVYAATNNTTVAAIDAGSSVALDAMCASELHALGHTGHRVGSHCVRTDAPRAATATELAAFERVRDAWRHVRDAHAAVAAAQDALASVIEAGDAVADGAYNVVFVRLVRAYSDLREACAAVGVALPELPGFGDSGGE